MAELDDALQRRISELSEEGDEWAEIEDYSQAVQKYEEALALLPDPVTDWTASTWLFTAIGDAWYLAEDFERAQDAFRQVMFCPGSFDNPFIHLRRGQVYFELGNLHRAENELTSAYMLAGAAIFANEDPKYFEHLKSVIRPPACGVW